MRPQSHDDSPKAPCGCGGAPKSRTASPCGQAEAASSRSVPQAVDPEPDDSGAFPIAGIASSQDWRPSGVRPEPIAPARNPLGRAPEPIPDPERLGENGVEVWLAKHQLFFEGHSGTSFPMSPKPSGVVAPGDPQWTLRPHERAQPLEFGPPQCTQIASNVRIVDFAGLRGRVCAVDLGTTSEPTVPRFSPTRTNALVAALPVAFAPTLTRSSLQALADMFPDIAERQRVFSVHTPVIGRMAGEEPSPRNLPGLFFAEGAYAGVVGTALRILWTFPEITTPRSLVSACGISNVAALASTLRVSQVRYPFGNPVDATLQILHVSPTGAVTSSQDGIAPRNPLVDEMFGSYVGINPPCVVHPRSARIPCGHAIFLSNLVDMQCVMADYFFWWAARLQLWSRTLPGWHPTVGRSSGPQRGPLHAIGTP
jgi:hypothetical protein